MSLAPKEREQARQIKTGRLCQSFDQSRPTYAAGNLLQYTLRSTDPASTYLNTYASTLARYDGYRETAVAASSDVFQAGSTTKSYDANGFLTGVADATKAANNRTFVNDASGVALLVNQNGMAERQLVVNGEVMGRYGVGLNEVTPRSGDGDPNFARLADFNFGYQPINGNYPAASAGTYAVRAGDTLRAIARGAYGDEQLWYRIAEANGLSGDSDLRVGQTLTIPSRVGTVHNSDQSFKPYDPSKITGDTTPNLPSPSRNDCGGLGQILVIVVAIAVTVLTAAALAAPAGTSLSGTFGAGFTALGGGGAAGGSIAAGWGASAAGVAAGTGAIGAAVGSIASQLVGNAIGVQDGFSWKQVGLSAISGGIAGGLGASGVLPGTNSLLAGRAERHTHPHLSCRRARRFRLPSGLLDDDQGGLTAATRTRRFLSNALGEVGDFASLTTVAWAHEVQPPGRSRMTGRPSPR